MNNNRLENIIANAISTERKDYTEYNENTKIRGSKHCAICDAFVKLGELSYIPNERHPKSGVTRVWNSTERVTGKVMHRVCISGAPRGVGICDAHYGRSLRRYLAGYSTEQTYKVGADSPNADGITTSFELETSNVSDRGAVELTVNHYLLLSSDSTVYLEGKVPIYYNLSGCTKLLGKIENLMKTGDIEINYRCGTHIHTGTMEGDIDFSRLFGSRRNVKNYIAFFAPLALHISRDYTDAERTELFGRTYGEWCRKVYFGDDFCRCGYRVYSESEYGMVDCHVAMFNVQHSYSIEWRLPLFRNAEQFKKCICAMQAVVKVLKDAYYTCGGDDISTDDLRKAGEKALKEFKAIFGR